MSNLVIMVIDVLSWKLSVTLINSPVMMCLGVQIQVRILYDGKGEEYEMWGVTMYMEVREIKSNRKREG